MAARSSVKGAASLRRLLRRLPDSARKELGDEFVGIGQRLLGRAKAEAPVKSGRLRAALKVKVAIKSLALRLGLLTKRDKSRYFYGYILDQGRRAQRKMIRRGPRKGSYINVRGIPRDRYDFVFGRRRDLQVNEIPRLRSTLTRILQRAATGAGND